MAIEQSVANLVIDNITDRCTSLKNELVRFGEKEYPSLGPYRLIKFLQSANDEIVKQVNIIVQDKDTLSLLTEEQIEIRLYRYAKLIPYLHVLLSFIKGAEIKDVPAGLINPLKRLISKFLPDTEIIFLSSTIFNYSFFDLATQIRIVFGKSFKDLLASFPEHLMVISLPESEKKNTLLHCIIAHEIGHGIAQRSGKADELRKLVYDNIDKLEFETTIKSLFQILHDKQGGDQPSLFPTELQVKEMITSGVNGTIANWIEELAADGLGVCILGPAFYFSFIHFITSCHYINDVSLTHPPPKVRIFFMSHFIRDNDLGFEKLFEQYPRMKEFFIVWSKLTESPSSSQDPVFKLVMKAIYKIQAALKEMVINIIGDNSLTFEKLSNLPTLVELLINIIPPNEIIDYERQEIISSDISSILNAGWATYISEFEEFSINVKRNLKEIERFGLKERLNEILSKAIELTEIRTITEAG